MYQGSLAYIGSEKAIADLPLLNGNVASGGAAAMWFWRSAYVVCRSIIISSRKLMDSLPSTLSETGLWS
jgi:NADH dehydrogenase FAD-containing subunit